MLEHKDIKGTVEFDQETTMFFGKLIGVNGLVMYEAENAEEFAKNFITAVEDYIKMCEENEMPIKKEYKGVFNVRTSPEIHERLFTTSVERGVKLNAIINEAFDFYLKNQLQDKFAEKKYSSVKSLLDDCITQVYWEPSESNAYGKFLKKTILKYDCNNNVVVDKRNVTKFLEQKHHLTDNK
ncbi:type II toxin-antitoxin system HicB family antitoxin [Chryseobacterium sp. R2ACT005]|uniref:type II toxin-antitoxin system HicB family antitoxin n=1 Tax=Chryseobacterium sp. R2ACT005 TaxID=3416668 RepID=UPI003CF992E3